MEEPSHDRDLAVPPAHFRCHILASEVSHPLPDLVGARSLACILALEVSRPLPGLVSEASSPH